MTVVIDPWVISPPHANAVIYCQLFDLVRQDDLGPPWTIILPEPFTHLVDFCLSHGDRWPAVVLA